MKTCTFFVPGTPCAKGSVKAYVHPRTKRAVVVPDNRPKLVQWTSHVRTFAAAVWDGPPTRDAVIVRCDVRFPRPKSHYGTGRNRKRLKDSAPRAHCQKPDWDKVLRAILDALTDLVYVDDCQVVGTPGCKQWANDEYPAGVLIRVEGFAEEYYVPRQRELLGVSA